MNATISFYPRSRAGSDGLVTKVMAFNSAVSIHAPARGATAFIFKAANAHYVSIHAPARGATSPERSHTRRCRVSIHAPARGATPETVATKAVG